jgi:hypothetical protein
MATITYVPLKQHDGTWRIEERRGMFHLLRLGTFASRPDAQAEIKRIKDRVRTAV